MSRLGDTPPPTPPGKRAGSASTSPSGAGGWGEGFPGQIIYGEAPIVANAGRETTIIRVRNTSVWPVHVGSHFHFFEVNRRLVFDRAAAYGKRLDILAGSTVRWEPGEEKEVRLVDYAGLRRVYGFNGLVDGALTPENRRAAMNKLEEQRFPDAAP